MSTDRPNLWTGNMDVPTQRSNSILSVYSLNHYNYISTSAYIRMSRTSKSTIPAHIIEGMKLQFA